MSRARIALALSAAVFAVGVIAAPSRSDEPVRASATCSDYDNQADAQRAKDTRDADGDGIYCESLPCPCLKPDRSPPPKKKPDRKKGSRLKSKRTFVTDHGRIGNLRYKPRTIRYVMSARIKGIQWDRWGASEAKGSGTIEWKYCDPSCAEGYMEEFAVTVTLSRRKVCRGYRRYTRLRWRFVEDKPQPTNPYERVFTTQRMVCPR